MHTHMHAFYTCVRGYLCMYVYIYNQCVHYLEHVDTSWMCGPGVYSSSAVRQH